MTKNPTQTIDRVLTIFEAVALQGPISLKDLVSETDVPRSAVHRALQNLQGLGWIRARLIDHTYEVTAKFDHVMANSHSSSPQTEEQEALMITIRALGCHVDLGMFRGRGKFETIESTDRRTHIGNRHSLVSSAFGIVALRQLSPIKRIRHLEGFLKDATPSEEAIIQSGQMAERLNVANPNSPLVSSQGISVPLIDNTEQGLSILIHPIPGKRAPYDSMLEHSQSAVALWKHIGVV
jgi:DNA-binding IclR family transcriptional regulator